MANQQQPKKHFPTYWDTLKHPSSHSSAPSPLPDSLSDHQTSTYQFILNTLSSPDFQLPTAHQTPNKLTQAEKLYCSRQAILRVCRATKWDKNRALKRLIDTLVWRREFGVDQIDHRELSHEAETGKQFTLGYDNQQRPILYMLTYRQNTKPSINQIKLLVWYLERTIDLMPQNVETLTLIIDFGDSEQNRNSTSQPTPISVAKEVLKILQTYYCEPWVKQSASMSHGFFGVFLNCSNPSWTPRRWKRFDPVVTDHVPADQLLKCFNGSLDFEYDHGIYYHLFAELTAQRKKKMLVRYERYGKGMIGISEFELRGSCRRSDARREQSVSSSYTAISSCTLGSTSSSAAGLRAQPTLKLQDGLRSSAVTFKQGTGPIVSDAHGITSKDSHSPRSESWKASKLSGGTSEMISSRPLSPNSSAFPALVHDQRSSSNYRAETRINKFFSRFQPKSSTPKRGSSTEPSWLSDDRSSPSPSLSPAPYHRHTISHSHQRHTISHPHQFQSLRVFDKDLPDHMSCSRRITGIYS